MAKTNILVTIKTSWRCLEDVLSRRMSKVNIFVLIKTSWIRLENVFWKRRQKTSWRHLLDVFIKTNVCWDTSIFKILCSRGLGKLWVNNTLWIDNHLPKNSNFSASSTQAFFTVSLCQYEWLLLSCKQGSFFTSSATI